MGASVLSFSSVPPSLLISVSPLSVCCSTQLCAHASRDVVVQPVRRTNSTSRQARRAAGGAFSSALRNHSATGLYNIGTLVEILARPKPATAFVPGWAAGTSIRFPVTCPCARVPCTTASATLPSSAAVRARSTSTATPRTGSLSTSRTRAPMRRPALQCAELLALPRSTIRCAF
jgi:hypothetical protein